MKFRPRLDRAAHSLRSRRISTVVVVVCLVSVFLISPDPPHIDYLSPSEPHHLAVPDAPRRQPYSDDQPLPAHVVERPRDSSEDLPNFAEHGELLANGMHGDHARNVNAETNHAAGDEPPTGHLGQQLLATDADRYAARAGDYVKNEFTEDRDERGMPEEVKPVGKSTPVEGSIQVPVTTSDEQVPTERQEIPQAQAESAPVGDVERKAETEDNSTPPEPVDAYHKVCLKHIVYDKPVKTGSTAVTKALKVYLDRRGESYLECSFASCTQAARDLCAERRERTNLVDHMLGDEDAVTCLGRMGYYKVTSIREPLERWESSFLYNRGKKASHYGIPYDASYEKFMSKYPACSLFDYYDGLGKRCEMAPISLDERIRRIVERYDEIIDLYHDDVQGQLHRRLREDLKEENRSSRPDHNFRVPIDMSRLENETKLYNALKQRQKQLLDREPELC